MTIYSISTDKNKLDMMLIHKCLSEDTYWAKGRSYEDVKLSFENSTCFGLYESETKLVGFCRVITDHCIFAYLLDVYVLIEKRNQGLGNLLLRHIFEHSELKNIRKWLLNTDDAQKFYMKFGFKEIEASSTTMVRSTKKSANNCLQGTP